MTTVPAVPPFRRSAYIAPMLALLKLIQSIIKTLHSDGTPGQVAAGMALGAALGLTPVSYKQLTLPTNSLV
jgi:uncharacterized protein (DUF2062 family)